MCSGPGCRSARRSGWRSPRTRCPSPSWRSSTTPWSSRSRGALDAGLDQWLFWGALALSLAIAFVVTTPVNRALMRRGLGHAKVHAHH
ncbi:DUF4396 domain-containing protein [Curtobacterium sp. MCJR17_043]|uniref:DUF4396 domain-containing protein n=1 Tax=Curtobacterium sp. MCJR17_043 TaxID=2175660 RepID=UPI0024DF924C|nr:DUF4396 domain-containing protein [Curtobacterium sp. MCJR17_043]WIB37151.1 DUF4396 domain-containing protein [Curtobacterium sp. MCJR17_043]